MGAFLVTMSTLVRKFESLATASEGVDLAADGKEYEAEIVCGFLEEIGRTDLSELARKFIETDEDADVRFRSEEYDELLSAFSEGLSGYI